VPQAQGEQWNRRLNSEQSFYPVCHSSSAYLFLSSVPSIFSMRSFSSV
jgi:hypothetical protein